MNLNVDLCDRQASACFHQHTILSTLAAFLPLQASTFPDCRAPSAPKLKSQDIKIISHLSALPHSLATKLSLILCLMFFKEAIAIITNSRWLFQILITSSCSFQLSFTNSTFAHLSLLTKESHFSECYFCPGICHTARAKHLDLSLFRFRRSTFRRRGQSCIITSGSKVGTHSITSRLCKPRQKEPAKGHVFNRSFTYTFIYLSIESTEAVLTEPPPVQCQG